MKMFLNKLGHWPFFLANWPVSFSKVATKNMAKLWQKGLCDGLCDDMC
nr:MAG TPA: Protein of unknown function (DUF3561) [Caudoviricetes sp.]